MLVVWWLLYLLLLCITLKRDVVPTRLLPPLCTAHTALFGTGKLVVLIGLAFVVVVAHTCWQRPTCLTAHIHAFILLVLLPLTYLLPVLGGLVVVGTGTIMPGCQLFVTCYLPPTTTTTCVFPSPYTPRHHPTLLPAYLGGSVSVMVIVWLVAESVHLTILYKKQNFFTTTTYFARACLFPYSLSHKSTCLPPFGMPRHSSARACTSRSARA